MSLVCHSEYFKLEYQCHLCGELHHLRTCRGIQQHNAPPCGGLTQAISLLLKMRLSRNILTGTVRSRTKGKARDACVDITAQRTAKHTTWMQVNKCMRSVRTCRKKKMK